MVGFSFMKLGRRAFTGCSHIWKHLTKTTTLLLWVEVGGRVETVRMAECVITYGFNFYTKASWGRVIGRRLALADPLPDRTQWTH